MDEANRFTAWKKNPGPGMLLALLGSFQGLVYSLCLDVLRHPEDAEDAAQKVFLEVLKVLPNISSPDGLRAWLYRASILTSLNLRRGEKRRIRHENAKRPITPALSEQEVRAIHERVA